MKIIIVVSILFLFVPFVQAEGAFGKGAPIQTQPRVRPAPVRVPLTAEQIDRVRVFKQLILEVDKKSLQETIAELEETEDPELSLKIQEAMAKTYAEIVDEEKVTDLKGKEWLYSVVNINVAYLQFGAQADDSGNALNRLIRRKLREYLPPQVLGSTKINI